MKRTVVTVGLILLSVAGLCGCGGKRELAKLKADDISWRQLHSSDSDNTADVPSNSILSEEETSDSQQLTALADTLEEAQEIADLYGIELDGFSYGVATYRTDKDITELINFGQENDYPTLAPNTQSQLHTAQ